MRNRARIVWGTAILWLGITLALPAQSQAPATFEVISIHPSDPEANGGFMMPMPNGGGYTVRNMSVKAMLAIAYRIPVSRIEGGPVWFEMDRYDVEARADHVADIDELHTMYKHLLADRFGLKFHIQTKEGPVYNLFVDKAGVKMKPSGSAETLKVPMIPRGAGDFVGTKVPMSYLCFFLGLQIRGAERPVIDKTGLTEGYDFTLTYVPENLGVPTDTLDQSIQNRPTLFDAVREQLGLRLEAARGPVDSFVIDHVDRPSPN